MRSIALSIMGLGFAAISVYAWLNSDGQIGMGWGLLAFLCWLAV